MSKSQFTKEDAKKLGIPLTLLRKWEKVMNRLWHRIVDFKKYSGKFDLDNRDNGIQIGFFDDIEYEITVNIVNGRYLSLRLGIIGNDDFETSISHVERITDINLLQIIMTIILDNEELNT